MERLMILRNFIITLPSIIYHSTLSAISKKKHGTKDNIIFNQTETDNLLLLVHGYHGHPCNFNPLINNMCSTKPNLKNEWNIVAINLNQYENYTENTVQNEANIVLDYIRNCKKTNIVLVGLSKGGLVCTTAYSIDPNLITKVITISSPLRGTRSCDLYLPKILDLINGNLDYVRNDLGFGSSTSCNTLNILANVNDCHNKIYHIVPTYDHMIYPEDAAKYPFTKPENVYTYYSLAYSHNGIPFNKEIADVITKWLKFDQETYDESKPVSLSSLSSMSSSSSSSSSSTLSYSSSSSSSFSQSSSL